MKKIALMVLMVTALFSCQKEEAGSLDDKASTMVLTINVNRALNRAVEDGHPGNNADKVSPKILSVTVLSYDDLGVELGASDLTPDQIKLAIWGSYQVNQGGTWNPVNNPTKPNGVTIGLPKGTTFVDVVVNRAPVSEFSKETNINYFNYRDNKNGQGDNYTYGEDNFDRVILTTDNYGKGAKLANPVMGKDIPTYIMDFTVKPHMTRMEVYGGINVAKEEIWTDGNNNLWKTLGVNAYEGLDQENRPDADGFYPKGAVKGTSTNGFDVNTVYIPEYYWFRTNGNLDEPVVRDQNNSYDNETDIATGKAGWVKQPYYSTQGAVEVKWFPNRYYAVDVESIFINNIRVQSAERDPYMHQWPGSEADKCWPDWYKAFHIGGWHETGSSTGNTYLCMGNMWDRVAEAAAGDYTNVTIPGIGGVTTMQIITGKALPTTGKSEYYDKNDNRNLRIADGKAAAYIVYPQKNNASTGLTEATKLRHELPHVIVKVKLYENATKYAAGEYVKGKEFITLSLFSEGAAGAGAFVTDFKGGNIYRFNLNDLLYSFVGNVPVPGGIPTDGKDPIDPVDPDPEMPESQLIMTVKILEWVIQNIFPVI